MTSFPPDFQFMLIGIDASRAQIKDKTGTENYSFSLIKHLTGFDQKNQYFLYQKDSKPLFELSANFKIKPIDLPRLWTQLGLAWECLLNPPDILFIPAHTLPVIRRPGLKTVVTVHDLGAEFLPEFHRFPQKLYLNKSTEYAVRHATHLIAVSENTKKDLIKKLGADPNKITVVYEGIDISKFQISSAKAADQINQLKRKYKIKGDYLLFVGTIQPRKNLVRLIEAFSKIEYDVPYLTLVLAGKSGWLADEIYQAPKKFKVEDRVQFLNYVADKDLSCLYGGAYAFVFPSLYEGFGLPVLEAMALGTPVVCSKTSSLPEVGGEAAIYVDPKSIESIVCGIQQVLSFNAKEKETLIQKGFIQVQNFSWQKCARQTLRVFEKVYGQKN